MPAPLAITSQPLRVIGRDWFPIVRLLATTGSPLAPAGMTIHPTSGKITWDLYQAPAVAPGTYPVTVRVSDSAGNTDTQAFTLTVLD